MAEMGKLFEFRYFKMWCWKICRVFSVGLVKMMIVKGLCGLKAEEIAFPKPPNSVQNLDKGCEVNIVYFF